jgi:hypothetical protein
MLKVKQNIKNYSKVEQVQEVKQIVKQNIKQTNYTSLKRD